MAPPKRKGGRTLPGTRSVMSSPAGATKRPAAADRSTDDGHPVTGMSSSRYTPPNPRANRPSPPWVPALMGTLLVIGALLIALNYLDVLPGATSNWYLLGGLGFILLGIVTATQWR